MAADRTADNTVSDYISELDKKVVFNVKTAALTYVAQDDVRDDFFKFEKAPAPVYANLGAPSHKILSSSEGDGKALSMNPTTLFAEVKTAEQTHTSIACSVCGSIRLA